MASTATDPAPMMAIAIQSNFFHRLIAIEWLDYYIKASLRATVVDSGIPSNYEPARFLVRFSHKIAKHFSGAAFKSAGHRLRRSLLKKRMPEEFDAEAIIRTIDRQKFEKIEARYRVANPGDTPAKYLNLPTWLNANLQRIRDLELDLGRRRRVLDIGSGSGYFLYICGLLGHDAVGLDVDDMPMFNETIALLGVKRVVWRIRKFVPLSDLGKKFDLITAHMVCFNNHKAPGLWGVPEWDFFLDDISRFLAPGGRIWFELNREYDGTCYTRDLKQFFENRGAQVISHRVIFNQAPRAHAAVAPVAR
jgi:SAM-dependent methyltransferase